ncbi:Tryptophan--tRNA ligase [Gammaproteobacteria bacterium]
MPAITPSSNQRVLSGMRPTGALHLGHYHGVLKNWLRLQHQYQCFFFVADWHALTTHYNEPRIIGENLWEMVIDWLAVGIDPSTVTLFIQSQVPEHAELHLLLSMITPVSWLERVPSYKDQQERLKERDLATYGFLGYPLLQAADILIYKAGQVPVGEDQVAHIELTREIARRFNHLYTKETAAAILPEPAALLTPASKMPGLDGQKMSKSYANTIALREQPASIEKKLRTMPTDPARVRRSDRGDPDRCPVWRFHEIYSAEDTRAWVQQGCRGAGIGCLDCKRPVIDAVLAETDPFRKRAQEYQERMDWVRNLIEAGCAAARQVAGETLAEVHRALGLITK